MADAPTAAELELAGGPSAPVEPVVEPVAPVEPVVEPTAPPINPDLAAIQAELAVLKEENEFFRNENTRLYESGRVAPAGRPAPAGTHSPGATDQEEIDKLFAVDAADIERLRSEPAEVLSKMKRDSAMVAVTLVLTAMHQAATQQENQLKVRHAFYSAYPDLQEHVDIVQSAAARVESEIGTQAPKIMLPRIAQAARERLNAIRGGKEPNPAPAPTTPAPRGGVTSLASPTTTSAPVGKAKLTEQEAEMAELAPEAFGAKK